MDNLLFVQKDRSEETKERCQRYLDMVHLGDKGDSADSMWRYIRALIRDPAPAAYRETYFRPSGEYLWRLLRYYWNLKGQPERKTFISRHNAYHGSTVAAATEVGGLIAGRAKDKGIADVVFDRGGFQFHGRIKALAEAAREGGLAF